MKMLLRTPPRDEPFTLTGLAVDLTALAAVFAFVAGVGTFLMGIG